MRIRRISGVVLLAVGLGLAAGPMGAGAAESPPPLVTTLQTVVDSVGDVLNAITNSVFDNSRADITSASLEYAPGWIRMKAQLKTPTDPLKDPKWNDGNDLEWALDTNGDGLEDYTVEFATDKGELYGAVFDASKPDQKSACDADSASFSPQDGYTLVIDPKCIGNPKSLGYAATMYFDTDPKDNKLPAVSDRVPDQGFTLAAAPGQPAPAPGQPAPVPTGAQAAPSLPAGSPTPTAPKGAPPAPKAGAPGSTAPGRTASGAVPGAASGARVPAAAPAAAGTPTPAAGPAPTGLARTGSPSQTRALLGLGIMLLGAGLLVMTRPSRRRTASISL
jgi:hypothetical protein